MFLLPTKPGGAPHPDLHLSAAHIHLCEGPPGEGDKALHGLGVLRRDGMEAPSAEHQKQALATHKELFQTLLFSQAISHGAVTLPASH